MTPHVAAIGAALATALALLRPAVPARVRRVRSRVEPDAAPTTATALVSRCLAAAGRPVRLHLLRRPRASRTTDRRIGAVLALGALAIAVGPLLAVVTGATSAVAVRWVRIRRQETGRQLRSIEADLPELVDLIALTVAAGLTVPEALGATAPCAPPSVRGDVDEAVAAIRTGARVEHALLGMGRRWDEPGRPLVHALVDHARYGTPLLPSLERVGLEARTRRRRAAETRARRLPVLLLFPLVLCTLPAFGLLTVAPLVAGTLGSLDGNPLEAPASTAP